MIRLGNLYARNGRHSYVLWRAPDGRIVVSFAGSDYLSTTRDRDLTAYLAGCARNGYTWRPQCPRRNS
jgi:hypothetical protein